MLERWREQLPEANLGFVRSELVLYTFGNASGLSRERGLEVIKPSDVPYERLKPAHVTVVNLNGKIVQASSDHRPTCPPIASSTMPFLRSAWWPTRISEYATAWAQARKPIPCFGTTHADYFHGPVPEFTGTPLASFPPVDDTGGRFSFLSRYW